MAQVNDTSIVFGTLYILHKTLIYSYIHVHTYNQGICKYSTYKVFINLLVDYNTKKGECYC